MDWKPKTQGPPNFRSLARASFRPSICPKASSSSMANQQPEATGGEIAR